MYIFWTGNNILTNKLYYTYFGQKKFMNKQIIYICFDKKQSTDQTHWLHKTVHCSNKQFTYILDMKQSIDQTNRLHIFWTENSQSTNKYITYILDIKQCFVIFYWLIISIYFPRLLIKIGYKLFAKNYDGFLKCYKWFINKSAD